MTAKKLSQQEIAALFQQKKNELQALAQKIGELDMEKEEHKYNSSIDLLKTPTLTITSSRLVIDTMEPLDPKRKCFRLVGGVLVERTIEEVLPALKLNSEGVS
jgi:prefoldin subunit 2